jgi:hypothetical protein
MLAVALAVALAACGSDSPTGPKDVPGTYLLRTINGNALPFTVPNTLDHTIVINSVTATLNGNDTYAVAGTGTQDENASTVITDAGTYTQSGSTLHFTSAAFQGAVYTASAKTDTVTVTLPGGFVNSSNGTFALLFVKGS